MPIGPKDLAVDEEVVKAVITNIDTLLRNGRWLREEQRGDDTNPSWMFVGPSELSEREARYIEQAYLAAGWGTVRVRNSGENGERPGLWSVTLYKYEQF